MAKKPRTIKGLSSLVKESACEELEKMAVKNITRIAKGKTGKMTNIVPSFAPTRLDAVLKSASGLNCKFLENL